MAADATRTSVCLQRRQTFTTPEVGKLGPQDSAAIKDWVTESPTTGQIKVKCKEPFKTELGNEISGDARCPAGWEL